MRLRSILVLLALIVSAACTPQVKPPAVAGAFYPADPAELRSTVKDFLDHAGPRQPDEGRMLALITPHAGYAYSGQVAAYGYKNLPPDIDTVVLIGPSHHEAFTGASVYTEGAFQTPLGDVPIDETLASSLIDPYSDVAFLPGAYAKEHSLEVQLPFLQSVLGKFKIVPVLVGRPTRNMFDHLATAIARILAENPRAIAIASSDMSHYHPYDSALKKDAFMIESIESLAPNQCEQTAFSGNGELCGLYPVMITLEAARRMGANETVKFMYANSGDTTGKLDSVVGYLSMGIYKSPLTADEKQQILSLARSAISEGVLKGDELEFQTALPRLRADAAVFVTINRQGRLRGCIGTVFPTMPLYKSIIKNSIAAALHDNRFKPMTPPELNDMQIEVSILSPMIPVSNPQDIVVGRDGLYIVKDKHNGILLPQVPVEFGWSREEYLQHLAEKAGLPPDAWREHAQIYRFEAEVLQ